MLAGTKLFVRFPRRGIDRQRCILHGPDLDFSSFVPRYGPDRLLRQNANVTNRFVAVDFRAEILVPAKTSAPSGARVFVPIPFRRFQGQRSYQSRDS